MVDIKQFPGIKNVEDVNMDITYTQFPFLKQIGYKEKTFEYEYDDKGRKYLYITFSAKKMAKHAKLFNWHYLNYSQKCGGICQYLMVSANIVASSNFIKLENGNILYTIIIIDEIEEVLTDDEFKFAFYHELGHICDGIYDKFELSTDGQVQIIDNMDAEYAADAHAHFATGLGAKVFYSMMYKFLGYIRFFDNEYTSLSNGTFIENVKYSECDIKRGNEMIYSRRNRIQALENPPKLYKKPWWKFR